MWSQVLYFHLLRDGDPLLMANSSVIKLAWVRLRPATGFYRSYWRRFFGGDIGRSHLCYRCNRIQCYVAIPQQQWQKISRAGLSMWIKRSEYAAREFLNIGLSTQLRQLSWFCGPEWTIAISWSMFWWVMTKLSFSGLLELSLTGCRYWSAGRWELI
jgi:hypothetical protein